MRKAADFRSVARNALSGRWAIAVLAGLLASLLGAIASTSPSFDINLPNSNNTEEYKYIIEQYYNPYSGWNEELLSITLIVATVFILTFLAIWLVFFVLGSIVEVGYFRFNLDLVDRQQEPKIGTLFSYFRHWKTLILSRFLREIYVTLWSLLFLIPGIIATYSYAMTSYILAEHPDMSPNEAITRSKEMMRGNRFRLFCLQLSFIGWALLCSFTCGIGNLWLVPYEQAAFAAFYREVSGTEYMVNS